MAHDKRLAAPSRPSGVTAAAGGPQRDDTRSERDRFVALAFAAADLLFELDASLRIAFAGGATRVLLGREQAELTGAEFLPLIAAGNRGAVERALQRARPGDRFDHVAFRFAERPQIGLFLRGYRLADLGGNLFLAVRLQERASAPETLRARQDPESGLIDRKSFADVAAEALAAAQAAGEELRLSFVTVADASAENAGQSSDMGARTDVAFGAALKSAGLGADKAAKLDNGRYGLVHSPELDLASLRTEIGEVARALDPARREIEVTLSSMELDSGGFDPAQAARVIRYAIGRYCEHAPEEFALKNLSQCFAIVTEETVGRMERLARLIESGDFSVAYQPICDLMTLRPHHFEALIRFEAAALDGPTLEIIRFAEEVGLIQQLDLAMCRKVLAELRRLNRQGHRYVIGVNISACSLSAPEFLGELAALLERNASMRDRIVFEVTESAKVPDLTRLNDAIQSLRQAGHVICLDDLGAGEAGFRYLSRLDVDVAKIDGQYVHGAITSAKGRALLRAMVSACRDLGIMTVGEMIETEAHAKIARECGLQYGQGYLFGHPAASVTGFEAPRPVALTPAAATPSAPKKRTT